MKAWICALALCLVACDKVVTYEPSPEKRQQDIENQSLSDAKALAVKNDLEGAHKKLSQIAMESPVRRTPEYVEIEDHWAEAQIAKADAEPDTTKKVALLEEVSKASAVSPELRAKASNKVALAVPDPALPPTLVNYDPELAKANLAKCKDLLHDRKLKEAKDLLYPRVMGGIASPDERSMLVALCARDAPCVNALHDAGVVDDNKARALMAKEGPMPSGRGECTMCPKK